MSLTITFSNLVFALAIHSAPTPAGPWSELMTSHNPCSSIHTLSINTDKPSEFFRLTPLDNGKAQTPGQPDFYSCDVGVVLICPPVYECQSIPVTGYHWYRDGVQFASTITSYVTDVPGPGMHLYQVQLITGLGAGWLSPYSTVFQ